MIRRKGEETLYKPIKTEQGPWDHQKGPKQKKRLITIGGKYSVHKGRLILCGSSRQSRSYWVGLNATLNFAYRYIRKYYSLRAYGFGFSTYN